jgi:hypothetical protein
MAWLPGLSDIAQAGHGVFRERLLVTTRYLRFALPGTRTDAPMFVKAFFLVVWESVFPGFC